MEKIVVVGSILVIQSICDIRWKKIPFFITMGGMVIGIILLFFKPFSLLEIGLAFLPGIACLLFSKMSGEALGYGDSLLFCMMGCFYSIEEILLILLTAFGFAGIGAFFLLLDRRVQVHLGKIGRDEIAFVPFLLLAYGVHIWIKK